MKLPTLAAVLMMAACGSGQPAVPDSGPSPYLLVFAGDQDEQHEDFLAVIDVRAGSETIGEPVATAGIGLLGSIPHHMEYQLPPAGQLLFANAHHHERTLLLDVADPLNPVVARTLLPPSPLRFGHDFARLPNGNVLLGFLRSEGPSPKAGDGLVPGGHGGLAEYTARGEFVRWTSAGAGGSSEPIRTYAIVPMLDLDRIVTTSAPMMEEHVADVVQVWRYSDLSLLHTIQVPAGRYADGSAFPDAARHPFGPRRLADGSILLNAFGCGLYRLTGIDSDDPELVNVYTVQLPQAEQSRSEPGLGACSIPVIFDEYWIMPVGRAQAVVVLDIADPTRPREMSRLLTPGFNAHWLARDPRSDRLVLGAEFGGEEGLYILRFDPQSGHLRFDSTIRSNSGREGYVDLGRHAWPHGATGPAWAHAALFLHR